MDIALLLSSVVALGIAAQWLAWYLKQPSILFLLLIGILVGPILGYFKPDLVLGELLFPFISLGVAVILFEGSLTLEFDEIKQHGKVVQLLVSVGVVITIAIVALSTYLLFDVDPLIALLFGSLVCVTGPTVIMPLLRSVRPNKTISNILKWEGIIIDPVGAIAVVLVYEYIISGGEANSIFLFGQIVVIATLIGLFGAFVLANLVKRHMLPEFLHNVFTLAFVLVLFSLSNHLEHESGLLAVTVMGVALANWKGFPREQILEFNESLTVLLISVLFIVLAARVELSSLLNVGFQGLVLLAIVMFVARPLSVWASSAGSKLKTSEKLMISWIGPRGIVAAAISSLFAIRLLEQPEVLQGVELLVPLVFMVIIGTVVIQGLGAKMVGNLLGVREPASNGVLIVGSNPIALLVAETLKEQGFEVLVAHNNYTNIAKARMAGLRTYFGNPVSDHADSHLDLIGIGYLFAMSMDKELNTLSELHYRHEFGEQKIYRLKFSEDKAKNEREEKKSNFKSRWLFGRDVTYTKMASMLSKKARIKITNITDSYTFTQYRADNKQFVPLYTIDKEGRLHIISDSFDNEIPRDHKLIALVIDGEVQPKEVDVTQKQNEARALANEAFDANQKAPEKRTSKVLSDDPDHNKTRASSSDSIVSSQDATLQVDLASKMQSKSTAVPLDTTTVDANGMINDTGISQTSRPDKDGTSISPAKTASLDTDGLGNSDTATHVTNASTNGSAEVVVDVNSQAVLDAEKQLARQLEQKLEQKAADKAKSVDTKKGKSADSVKSLESRNNGNSQAPKQANGNLDPERLPDTEARKTIANLKSEKASDDT